MVQQFKSASILIILQNIPFVFFSQSFDLIFNYMMYNVKMHPKSILSVTIRSNLKA